MHLTLKTDTSLRDCSTVYDETDNKPE